MIAQMMWLSTFVIGVNAGWQPLPEGGMEYIIQLDPQTMEALKAGQSIYSDIPPGAGDVRSYKIVVGSETLPRVSPPTAAAPLPRTFLPEPGEKPLTANSAGFLDEQAGSQKKSNASAPNNTPSIEKEPSKPWMALIFVSLGLFASLGGNVYLTWLIADLRRRFRALTSRNCS
jgi:hypothetical protein